MLPQPAAVTANTVTVAKIPNFFLNFSSMIFLLQLNDAIILHINLFVKYVYRFFPTFYI